MKQIWRFQGDVPYGETDPMVTVFMGDPETEDGVTTVRQDTKDPVQMRLSDLIADIGAMDHAKLAGLQAENKAAAKLSGGAKSDEPR